MAPAVDELASRNAGKALITKLNTDHAPRTSESFGIRGVPTVIVFKHGAEVARSSGALPVAKLQELLDRALTT
jgi:thioredoxin-like negative regulator of GroEL